MNGDHSTWPLVRFAVIKEAWGLYKQHALVWSLAVLIMMATNSLFDSVIFGFLGKGQALGPGGFKLFLPAAGAARLYRLDHGKRFLGRRHDSHGRESDPRPGAPARRPLQHHRLLV